MNNDFMRGRFLLITTSILFLGLFRGIAQDSNPRGTPPPTAPFLKPLPDYATWTMIVTPLPSTPSPPPSVAGSGPVSLELKQRQVAQTGTIRQEINTWSNGSTSQNWIIDGKRLVEDSVKHSIIVIDPARSNLAFYFSRLDFLDIKWLSLDTFVRTEAYQKHLCYFFQKKIENPPATTNSPHFIPDDGQRYQRAIAQTPGQAWIDITTKQMVAYSDGSNLYIFDYRPPPTTELVLPPAFAQKWQRFQDDMNPLKIPVPPTR